MVRGSFTVVLHAGCLVMLACGPGAVASVSADGTSSGDTDVAVSSDDAANPQGTVLTTDEQRCVDFCLAIADSDCSRSDGTCFAWCMARLEHEPACPDEVRAAIDCETAEPFGATCRAETGCDGEYKAYDFCRGFCAYGGGSGGSGGSNQSGCSWSVSDCYGHTFKTTCYVDDDDSPCVCFADDELLATCFMGYGIEPFAGCQDLSIFTTCCRALYEEILFP